MDDVNELLRGSGIPIARFDQVGRVVRGKVVSYERRQSRDFKSKKLKFYEDGQPIWMVVVTVQTDERDESVEEDDGMRRIYFDGAGMMRALREGVKRNNLAPGGNLAVKYTGDGTPPGPGLSAPKEYAVRYEPPVIEEDDLPF